MKPSGNIQIQMKLVCMHSGSKVAKITLGMIFCRNLKPTKRQTVPFQIPEVDVECVESTSLININFSILLDAH